MANTTPAERSTQRGIPLWAVLATMVAAQAVILGAFALFIYPG